jgi:archaeal type IV pilus assembly protein PilA
MNYYMRKIKKNTKALSPVVASIILIAVTVAVSVVVAAWMGGMSMGLMNNAEQVTASNPVFTANTVTLTMRNTGASSVIISAAGTIDGKGVIASTTGSLTIAKGTTQDITLSRAAADGNFTAGAQYQLGLVTSKGTSIVYTATYNP